jgi:hypothetical protein
MKRAISIAIALSIPATEAPARDDKISLWADADRAYCAIASTPGVHSVHIFHTGSEMATASRFSAPKPACWTGATWIGDFIQPSFLALGSSQTDLSVVYQGAIGACTLPTVYIGRIDYLVSSTSPPCCDYEVLPVPTSPPGIWVVDCYFIEYQASAGSGVIVNPTVTCPCPVAPPNPGDAGIALFADAEMSSCSLTDTDAGVKSVHMFHTGSPTTMGVQFSAPLPACWTGATWLADHIAAPFLFLGNSQTDLSIVYGTCHEPPIYLGRVDFYSTGVAGDCCEYAASAAAGTGGITVVDCNFETQLVPSTGRVVINPTPDCPCDSEPPVSVQKTTWGKIKAMYRR